MSTVLVRQATLKDLLVVSDILSETASWLKQRNMTLWTEEEISPEAIRFDIQSGLFYLASCEDYSAGVVKFQTEDLEFWSDVPHQDSAFIHRLAVRRSFAGGSVSKELRTNRMGDRSQLSNRQTLFIVVPINFLMMRWCQGSKFGFRKIDCSFLFWLDICFVRFLFGITIRLDCDAECRSLRSVYKRFGFGHHSDKQVGSYFIARYEYKIEHSF